MNRQADSTDERQQRARAMSVLYASGASLSLLLVLLPGWDGMANGPILGTVAVAAVTAALLWWQAARTSRRWVLAAAAAGIALIGLCQVFAGGGTPSAMYAMLYLWVVLFAAAFLSWRDVLAQLLLSTTAHVAALAWLGELSVALPQLVAVAGTQVAAAVVVGRLAVALRSAADVDMLTGVASRRAFSRALNWACEQAQRSGASLTVAVLDLDGFKRVNDTQGHQAGDQLLAEVASAWSGQVRAADLLGRVGGDEFALILAGSRADEAVELVGRLRAVLPAPLGVSAGLTEFNGRESPDELLGRADRALYDAKDRGGGAVVVADPPVPAGR